jgi:DNA invertase Pin-like site-specific DNA recombinase
MTRAVLYARYSSDNQREASIEDQFRLCRMYAERHGWKVGDNCRTSGLIWRRSRPGSRA